MRVLPESSDDNPLKIFFQTQEHLKIHKWHHYFDIYHNHFQRFRGKSVRLLEIGVASGGSLQMWKHYFGEKAIVFGVDIRPRSKSLEEDRIKIFIGDQSKREFLLELRKELGSVDILIDDGGHTMAQQINTFEVLYELVDADGVYLVEDLHTSYWSEFGGGVRRGGTFIERAKGLVDSLHAWHSRSPDFSPDRITTTATGVHFYDSALVIEKCRSSARPKHSVIGDDPFEER